LPPFDTCDVEPELGASCYHEVTFSNGTGEDICRAAPDPAPPRLTNPPVYCALDVGVVDAGDVPDVGPITLCQLDYRICTPPGVASRVKGSMEAPGAPGWLCCDPSGPSFIGSMPVGSGDFEFICQNPDGGPIPLYFPPPIGPDAGDAEAAVDAQAAGAVDADRGPVDANPVDATSRADVVGR
jgi:hypothetical protein